jgi:rhamnogalacturonan endolyase
LNWIIQRTMRTKMKGPKCSVVSNRIKLNNLQMFTSTHYSGKDLNTKYRNGKPWKKVLGPVFVYLNSISSLEDPTTLWEDAKDQVRLTFQQVN